MNKQLSGGNNSTVLLLSALILALLFAMYYYVVKPKQDEVVAKESSVASLQQQTESLRQQIVALETVQTNTTVDVFALRKKVPDSRAVDKLLLNIEQIEFVSGTRVGSIGFNNYDSLVSSSGLTDPNQVNQGEGTSTDPNAQADPNASTNPNGQADPNANSQQTGETAPPVSTISPEQLPAELKMLTLSISVEAPDYDSLQRFIREIEGLERVVRVDTINYSLDGEESTFSEEGPGLLSASVQVTTFYYEGK